MELAYDNAQSALSSATYSGTLYNGNITGTVWRSSGDAIARKYDFTYDNVNRITAANYTQNTTGSAWDHTLLDFTTNNLTYDANGNILSMSQKGFKIGGSALIDQLTYNYQTASNKLQQVTDGANDPTSKLGDLHYATGTKTSTDYTYDAEGNLTADNNKAISGIVYNYLNLPQQITITGKGTITYAYDAAGTKLSKVVVDNTAVPTKTTTTLYMGPFVYQDDTLRYVMHEEGRTRLAYHKYLNGSTKYGFEYDYFLKDHLGNTRVVLTQQKDTTNYIATMETAYRTTESQLFGNIAATAYARTSATGYPVDLTVTNPNDFVARVNGSAGQNKVGPNLLLKVMSGDKIDIAVQYYFNNLGTPQAPNSSFTDVLNSLANGLFAMTAGAKGAVTDFTNPAGPIYAGLNSLMGGNSTPPSKPKAYLNWMLLDEQFNYVSASSQSGALPVATAGTNAGALQPPLGQTGIGIKKNGYLYIWVSNETPAWDVFFDNLSVKHYTGPLVEESHYYPFGLTMAGISSQALKTNYAENKYQFGGKERQAKEFSDGSGLEVYDFGSRMYDNQIGRWAIVDGFAEKYGSFSPYHFAANNPIRFKEVDGRYFEDSKHNKVAVTVNKAGQVVVGKNASTDLARMANLVNSSGSKSAVEMFNKLGNNETKINFKIETSPKDNGLLGLHQAHDKEGPVKWKAGTDGTGTFEKMPNYIKGKDGKDKYKEASITIYEENFTADQTMYQQNKNGDLGLTKDEHMVAVFTHEGFHDTDQETLDAIKTRQQGGTNNYDVENAAETKAEKKVYEEVKKKRKN